MSTKRMLIDASHPEETRVVIANGTRLEDFDVESESRRQLKGNIYLAKVTRVEPSLQACFVDYGGNRHGFLAFSEIHPDYFQIPVADREALIAEHEAEEQAAAESEADAAEGSNGGGEGVETVGGVDDEEEVQPRRPVNLRRHYKIQEVIKRRQILLVQVVKEERGNKGAALTTYLSLAGRYCVLMPNTARGGGISRKISNSADRKKLKKILADMEIPGGMAVIVRTAGSKRTKAEIRRDYDYLMRLWSQVRDRTLQSIAPCLVHEEGNVVKRAIRDLYTKDIDEIIIEGNEAYRSAKDFMKLLIPSHAKKVQPYEEGGVPLLQKFQIENQMDAMHSPEVQLKSGGYIVINPTEALVSIDVNSGRATKERNIEETALRTNIEAAEEIARQLRLRDLAGLIVIDFIDMEVSRNQTKVERALKDAMRSDRARIQIGRISTFGLLELSRQRLRPSLHETSFEPCPYCGGSGHRRSTDSTALQMLRVLEEEGQKKRSSEVTLVVPTGVALYVFNNKRAALADIEARHGFVVRIEADDTLIPPDYRLERVKLETGDRVVEAGSAEGDEARGEEEGGRRRRRRRGRRRKRGGEGAETTEAQEAQDIGEEADEDREEDEAVAAAESGAEEGAAEGEGDTGEGTPRKRRRGRRGGRRRRKAEGETPETEGVEAAEQGEAGEAATEPEAAEAAEQGEEAEAEKKPRRSRGGRNRRAKSADTEQAGEAEAEVAAEEEAEAGAETEAATAEEEAPKKAAKPRRRRPSRKKAEAEAETAESAEEPAEPVEAAATEEPPTAETAEPEKAAEDETPAEPEEAAADEDSAEDTSKTTVIDVSEVAAEQPRRGWWQRGA